jgi:protein-S-isoprenylcysteine O-methyltransferase Ste14
MEFSHPHWFTLAVQTGLLAVVIVFLPFYYPAAIRYEDTKLEGVFGDSWRAWSRTRPPCFPPA